MFSAIKEEKNLNLIQHCDDKFEIESDDADEIKKAEKKFQDKYQISSKPLASNFLQKRLQRGQKFFDSGDYNMAIASKNKPNITCQTKDSISGHIGETLISQDSKKGIQVDTLIGKKLTGSNNQKICSSNSKNLLLNDGNQKHLVDNKIQSAISTNPNIVISSLEDQPSPSAHRKSSLDQTLATEVTGHVIPTPDNVPARKASIPLSTVLLKAQQPHQLTFPSHHSSG